ncbi:MAG: hypothetical protein MRQ07_01630 [Candidatus Midichloria sp.]|nr:hypothetical protein [Candidatus Midichloria sp.]
MAILTRTVGQTLATANYDSNTVSVLLNIAVWPTTITEPTTTTTNLCTKLSEVKEHIFGSLKLVGHIKMSIYGKYGLVYEDGVLNKLIVASSLDNNFLMICGSGAAGCEVETDCSSATIRSVSEDFCIDDDLGITISVS